jgi:mannose-6-phosphate isomerase-like protein (cupin superfamily)
MHVRDLKEGMLLDSKVSINLELGLVALKKDKFNKLGRHADEEEAYIILNGEAMLFLGEEKKKVRKGQVIYVPAGTAHQFTALTNDFKYIYVATWPAELKGRKNRY